MPNQGDLNRAEPGIPQGTNAGLLSSSGTPIHSETAPESFTSSRVHEDSILSSPGNFTHAHTDTGVTPSGIMGRVSNVADTGKSKLANSLHDLGDRIEHKGREFKSGNVLVRPVGRVLNNTGEALEDGANYLRTSDFSVIRDDFVGGIRNHPMLSAGIAVGCGWLLGQMMGGEDEEERESREEPRRREEETEQVKSSDPGLMGRVRGRLGDLVAGGIASMAARQVRDRIAGR